MVIIGRINSVVVEDDEDGIANYVFSVVLSPTSSVNIRISTVEDEEILELIENLESFRNTDFEFFVFAQVDGEFQGGSVRSHWGSGWED